MSVLCEWQCQRCLHLVLGGTLGSLVVEGKEVSNNKLGDEWLMVCENCCRPLKCKCGDSVSPGRFNSLFKVVGGWAGRHEDWNPNGVK